MFRFSSKAISEHAEVPLADEGQWEELVASWAERQPQELSEASEANACYVVSVGAERDPAVRNAQLGEIVSLVRSQGGDVKGQEICHLAEPNPRTLLGKGSARELAARARARVRRDHAGARRRAVTVAGA